MLEIEINQMIYNCTKLFGNLFLTSKIHVHVYLQTVLMGGCKEFLKK